MLRRVSKWIILALALSLPVLSLAQDNFCRQLIDTALQAADDVCSPTLRNQACYGHDMLEAQPQGSLDEFNFDEVGDIVEVAQIKTLSLSAMDLANQTWGVALMNLQANLPDENPNQNIKLLLFGDVAVRNIINAPTLVDVVLQSEGNVNVRRLPNAESFVIGTVPENATVTARGRSIDNDWILIAMPDGESEGWVRSILVADYMDILPTLSEVEPAMSEYGPMQAFYVRTGDDSTSCEEAPNDGMLIQTPEGVAEVRLWINQVKIRLGSTIFVSAGANGDMTIKTLEGHASVEAMGVEYTAMAGTSVSVQLGDDDKPSAPPKPPKPIKREEVENLPVKHLEREITVEILPTATGAATVTVPPTDSKPATTENVPPQTAEVSPTTVPATSTSVPVVVPSNTSVPTVAVIISTEEPPVEPPPATTAPPPVIEQPTVEPPPVQPTEEAQNPPQGSNTSSATEDTSSNGGENNGGSNTSSQPSDNETAEP